MSATVAPQPTSTAAPLIGTPATAGGTAELPSGAASETEQVNTGNVMTLDEAQAKLKQVLGPGWEKETSDAPVQVRKDGDVAKDFDKHTNDTMVDTKKSASKAHPQAYNAGLGWTGAAPLAPKDGFYDERYICATKSKEEVDEDDEIQELFQGYEGQDEPTRITLAFKQVNDNACQFIATELKINTCKCESLWLNDNKITSTGAKNIAEALKVNNTLTELYLNYNNIGDSGLKYLVDALIENKGSKLRKLELGCCKLGEVEGSGKKNVAAELVKSVISNAPSLEHVGLFGNHPNMDDDLPDIYETLETKVSKRIQSAK